MTMNETSRKAVEKLVTAQMPGWRLAASTPGMTANTRAYELDSQMIFDNGPSLDDLGRKYLGADYVAGVSRGLPSDVAGPSVTTVRIEPVDGGSAKTADILDGQVIIVQG